MAVATGVTRVTATIVLVFTPRGTLEIIVDDPNIKVAVDGEEIGIEGAGPREVRLRLGEHQVQAIKDGKTVFEKLVTLSRDGKQIVAVNVSEGEPAGTGGDVMEPETLQRFDTSAKPLTGDGIAVEGDAWKIEADKGRTVRMFEVADPGVEDCMITYRARMKAADVAGQAYLEMWCRFPGGGEYFSKGLMSPVKGTVDWASYETPFFLRKGERPDLVKLNVVVEGSGTVWIKDVELLKSAMPRP
jgi:hypothetical protein